MIGTENFVFIHKKCSFFIPMAIFDFLKKLNICVDGFLIRAMLKLVNFKLKFRKIKG